MSLTIACKPSQSSATLKTEHVYFGVAANLPDDAFPYDNKRTAENHGQFSRNVPRFIL